MTVTRLTRGTSVPKTYSLGGTAGASGLGAPGVGTQARVTAEMIHAVTGAVYVKSLTVLETVDGLGVRHNKGVVQGALAADTNLPVGLYRVRFHAVYPDGTEEWFPSDEPFTLIITQEPVGPAARTQIGRSLVMPYTINAVPAQMPAISRGLPFYASSNGAFGGSNAEANAVDADYGTFWRSIDPATVGDPEWFVLDISGVPAAQRASVWAVWKNPTQLYQPTQPLGALGASSFVSVPRNYKLQGHVAAGGGAPPAEGDAGWVNLNEVLPDGTSAAVNIVDNYYSQRIHKGLDLRPYNWFRIIVTASNGVLGATDDVQLQIDLRNATPGTFDSILVYGDSIVMEAFRGRRVDNAAWVVGPIENLLQVATGRVAPVLIDAGVPGWTAMDGDSAKANIIGKFPCHWVALCFGANDANNANIDLNTLGGVNSAYAQAYKAAMQSMVNYAVALGYKVIIPTISYGDTSAWSAPNVAILNTIIAQLVASNLNSVISGPDVYTLFQAHQNLLRDHLHPTWDNAVGGGLYNGMTGYENLLTLWRDRLVAALYS